MEKINRQRAPKGTVTIRKKGNSYEARVTLALNSIMEGVDKNPRLSRTARSEQEARKRLGELITDVYFDIKRNSTIPNVKVFTEECSSELNKFAEFNEEKEKSSQTSLRTVFYQMVYPEGFEPPICKFVACHSIQLNYGYI